MKAFAQKTLLILAGALLGLPTAGDAQEVDYQEEMAALAASPAVVRALQLVDERDARAMADLIALTEIPAPPFMEEVRGARFMEMLLDLGVDSAWTDVEGNVIGLRRGTGSEEVVAVTGHLDTVFPEGTDVTVRQRGDTLFAPGIADDTRGLGLGQEAAEEDRPAGHSTIGRERDHVDARSPGDIADPAGVGAEQRPQDQRRALAHRF